MCRRTLPVLSLSLVSILVLHGVDPCGLIAQNANPIPWEQAISAIDGSLDEEDFRAEQLARQSLESADARVEMAIALALLIAEKKDAEGAKQICVSAEKQFGNAAPSHKQALLRIKLWSATMTEDKLQCDLLFRDVVRALLIQENAESDRRLNSGLAGAIVGVCESNPEDGYISPRTLDIAKNRIVVLESPMLRNAFSNSRKQIQDRANLIQQQTKETTLVDLSTRQAQLKEIQAEVNKLEADFTTSQRSIQKDRKANLDTIKDLKLQLKKGPSEIAKIERESKQITPGHPGQPLAPPQPPIAAAIRVDEYEFVMIPRADKDGNLVRTLERFRRSNYDIDTERQQKYTVLQREHEDRMSEYRSYQQNHQKQLDAWLESDKKRKEELKEQVAAKRKELDELKQEIEQLESMNSKLAEELVAKRLTLQKQRDELELAQLAMEAVQSGNPDSALSFKNFRILDFESERKNLAKSIGN